MSHDAYTDRLLDLAYGELSPREARKVEGHVASCEACRAELLRIRETRALMSGLAGEPVPPEGERILLAAAREAAEARRPRRRLLPPWLLGAAVAVTALVAVGAVSYRLLALRPGPLGRDDREALLGGSYAAAERAADGAVPPEREASGPGAAPAAGAEAGARPKAAPLEAGRADSAGSAPPAGTSAPAPAAAPPPPPPSDRAAPPPPPEPQPAASAPSSVRAPAERHAELASPPTARPEAFAAAEPPAPPAARAEGRGPSRSAATKSAAPAAASGAAAPTVEVREFAGCEGEARRQVEHDARGRIVRYVREGTIGGRRLVVEHVYRADGALDRVTVRDLDRPGAALDPAALGLVLVDRAEDAGAEAPPRCGPGGTP